MPFSQFEDIDTQDYISYECYYDYEYMYDEVLADIMEDFKSLVFDKLEKESKYKIKDLHTIANKLGISIKITGTNRNKKKSDLYQEISFKIKNK